MVAFESGLLKSTHTFLDQLQQYGEAINYQQGEFITKQYQKGQYFYLLTKGKLAVAASKNPEEEPIQLGSIDLLHAPIGWSAFNAPHRYTVDISVSSSQAELIRFNTKDLSRLSTENHSFGIGFYQFLLSRAHFLISESLSHLSKVAPAWKPLEINHSEAYEEFVPGGKNLNLFLRKSPFFEAFDDMVLKRFSSIIKRRDYRPGDYITVQGNCKDGFYMLDQGWVDFVFEDVEGKKTLFRSISTPGFNISWFGLTDSHHYASAIARRTTSIYFIEESDLEGILKENPLLALQFLQRLLWLVNHQIQVIRARFLTFTFDTEWIAVKTLIEANATRLKLGSELHEIPHLLKHKHTQKRAFELLHELHDRGDVHERHLASLALDNVQELSKEYHFYQGLIQVYQSVASLPLDTNSCRARKACAESVINAFQEIDYDIQGWENLPENSGHIFIYNHIKNHPYNTLPNNFQVTLDSHFISSLVSYQKYEDAGLRVVRVGKDIEYGHQEYYEKLGHIDVYTSESDERHQSKADRALARAQFFQKAGNYLKEGKNLIISPEGTSYETSESPGPFKSGSFRLALSLEEEPLIIPIVVANFDKRVRYNQYRCKIFAPFYISDHISDPNDRMAMESFLTNYQSWYKEQVRLLAQD